jgi:beta-mannosidase
VPYHKPNCPIPNGNTLRKPQCDFGWDWNIALAPFGVYGAIGFETPGPRLSGLVVEQTHGPGWAEVTVAAHVPVAAEMTLAGQVIRAESVAGVARATFRLTDPALWWPAGLGAQTLHDLTLCFGGVTETRRIGLRRLDLVTEPDAAGLGFTFRVNGHDTFARGANWIPADALAGRISREAVRDLLQSAVDANMNMIRVWGGGRYEPDWFYDLCDELGLMVWQDFMFACHLYPSTPAFLAEVQAEVHENALRIGHHACLALWCGDNELIGALTWFEESRRDRDRYLVSYDRLNRTVEEALKSVAPGANWWPSSPSPGPMSFGDAWHNDASGDMHFWSVWHEGRDFDHYRDVRPRFCSEFGFQSYPSLDVIARFAEPQDFNIAAPVMESHQKNAGGNARIAETMFRYFRFPEGFGNFVWLSQVQQGLAIKTAVTQWRSLKPHCMGALYWQLNDTWPVCSWSGLDHGGGWKILHHMAQGFFAPVTVVAVPEGDRWRLVGVNDTRHPVSLTLETFALSMTGGLRPLAQVDATLGTDAAETLATLTPGPDEVLYWRWTGPQGAGEDHIAPRPYKTYALPAPRLHLDRALVEGVWHLTLTAGAPAFFATVEADQPGRFSRKAILVLPGQPQQLTFTPHTADTPQFTLRDLHSATTTQ